MAHAVVVVVMVFTRVRPRHVVRREAVGVAPRAMHAVTIVVPSAVTGRRCQSLTLHLSCGLGQHGDITATVVRVHRWWVRMLGKGGEGVRRRDVGRGQGRGGSRADRLGCRRRRHHALMVHMRRQALVMMMVVVLVVVMLALVPTARVGVVVNSRVTSQLIGAGELLAATGELASMRLLARVSANMSCLVFETMESLVTERALVRTRKLVGRIRGLGAGQRPVGLDDGD